jgi:hypothetical protein
VLTLAVPSLCMRTLPASCAICMAKLSTGGPLRCCGRAHFLRSDLEDVWDLLVPVSPGVIAGQLAKLVWNLLVYHQLSKIAVVSEYQPRVFRATVEEK